MHIKTNILTLNSKHELESRNNVFLNIENGKIIEIKSEHKGQFKDYSCFLAMPGYIDTHVHIAQYNIRGRYRPNLLDWLNDFTFIEEGKFANPAYAHKVTQQFYKEALSQGTTCIAGYMTIHQEACEIAFQNAKDAGIRAFIGKVMMDQNCPENLKENTDSSLQESIDLYEKWHEQTELLEYIFSPRFAPTCSWNMMKELGKYIQKNNCYLQTHLAENLNENAWVKELFPKYTSYTDIYAKAGLMGKRSIFGHSIHLSQEELQLIQASKSKISHCPDSNFFLKSGAMQIKQMKEMGIDYALGSDIAAGTSLNMPYQAKMSIYRQDSYPLNPLDAYYSITLGAAKVLGIEDKVGSLEIGKDADMILYNTKDIMNGSLEDKIANIIFTGQDKKIEEVFVKGRSVYKIH